MIVPPIASACNGRRRAPTTARIAFLRSVPHPYLFGVRTAAGEVRFAWRKERFVREYNRGKKRRLHRLANWRYERHFAGAETYYFTGASSKRAPRTLALVDIDCHRRG